MIGRILGTVFFKAPAKMMSTVVVASGIVVGMFAFMPDFLVYAQEWADGVADWAKKNVPLDNQPKALFNTLVNEMTVLGLATMVVARSIVEIIAQLSGAGIDQARKSSRSDDDRSGGRRGRD